MILLFHCSIETHFFLILPGVTNPNCCYNNNNSGNKTNATLSIYIILIMCLRFGSYIVFNLSGRRGYLKLAAAAAVVVTNRLGTRIIFYYDICAVCPFEMHHEILRAMTSGLNCFRIHIIWYCFDAARFH